MMSLNIRAAWFLTLGAILFPQFASALSLTPSLVAQGNYEVLHWRGVPAVDMPSGVNYSSAATATVLNAQGEYAFNTRSFAGAGIWTNSTSGVVRLVVGQGLLPGDSEVEINPRYDNLYLTNAGATYFHADVDDGTYDDRGVFRETYHGGLETLLLPGTSYSDLPLGTYLDSIFLENVSRGGTALIRASVRDTTTEAFLYDVLLRTRSGEPLTEFLRAGDSPAGLMAGESIARASSYYSPLVNTSGAAAVPVQIVGPSANSANEFAIVKSDNAGSEVLLRMGQTFGRVRVTNILGFEWTDQDQLYFNVSFNNGNLVSLYKTEVYGNITPVFTRSTPIAGLPTGVFGDIASFQVNNTGQTLASVRLFGTGVNDNNDDALVKIDSSGVQLIVREGQVATGFQLASYGTYPSGSTFRGFDISDEGYILFSAIMEDGGLGEVNANNNTAYWLISPGGATNLLVQNYDDTLPFPSDINRISLRGVSPSFADSQASGFADNGTVLMRSFWGSLLIPGEPVPEPASSLPLAFGVAIVLARSYTCRGGR